MVECYMKHGNILNGTMFTGTDPNTKSPRNISIKSGKNVLFIWVLINPVNF